MVPAVIVPADAGTSNYDDDFYTSSYGYDYNYDTTDNRKSNSKISYAKKPFGRRSGKPSVGQVAGSYSYYRSPYYGGGQYASRSGQYGSFSGHGGGKCCCGGGNNLLELGALALGFLALNGQLQNIIDAINALGRRKKKRRRRNVDDDDETTNGKMLARSCFAFLHAHCLLSLLITINRGLLSRLLGVLICPKLNM